MEIRFNISMPVVLVATGVAAYWSKPAEETFEPYLKDWLKKQTRIQSLKEQADEQAVYGTASNATDDDVPGSPSGIARWISDKATSLYTKLLTLPPVIKDWCVVRVATVKHRGCELVFVGVFGHWFAIHSIGKLWKQLQST
jgi:hypothetical protein